MRLQVGADQCIEARIGRDPAELSEARTRINRRPEDSNGTLEPGADVA
jgi:hypothetical protein